VTVTDSVSIVVQSQNSNERGETYRGDDMPRIKEND
jgi:hypothetical protein